jgi:uncharacterized membrane protein YhiD involved in acid resistance
VTITIEQAAINLAVACGLSAVISFERQWRNRLAGLRTNTLVALGSASFVIFESLVPGSRPTLHPSPWQTRNPQMAKRRDPCRGQAGR